jgi:TRAP-type C4-dicarboxylate transport system substrate-binding protein
MTQIRKIRWLLEHEPIELFQRTAEAFDKEIRALTNNTIQIEIYKKEEYTAKFGKTKDEVADVLLMVNTAQIEMTQTQIVNVGAWANPDFFALEMPYLFKDHKHATRVLDGQIGGQLLNSIEETTAAKGLAFTYSGGYRVFAANKQIRTVEDLQGLTCLTEMNPVRVDTAKLFGYNVVADRPRSMKDRADMVSACDVVETTLPRYINEAHGSGHRNIGVTNHSMYLTTILINKDFYNSLTEDQQRAIDATSMKIAALEREWSVDDATELAQNTDKHTALDIDYHELDATEIAKLKEIVQPLYTKYSNIFSPLLIERMIKA